MSTGKLMKAPQRTFPAKALETPESTYKMSYCREEKKRTVICGDIFNTQVKRENHNIISKPLHMFNPDLMKRTAVDRS